MLSSWPILSIVIFLPLLGVLFILLASRENKASEYNCKMLALWVSSFTFILSLLLYIGFDPNIGGYQFVEHFDWIAGSGISYHLGIDGISMPFILLSTFLIPLSILASWNSIKQRVREFMIAFLVLETMMVGMFASLDMMMFYLFFEGVLIPMFLIIGIWGGPRRVYAAFKFFLYTLAGSVLMLVCIMFLYLKAGTTDILVLSKFNLLPEYQFWLFIGFFASFAVKVPMWPVHTWLPDAHVEAPTAGSMILAGVLLKMGGYGFIRFSLPMFPDASVYFAPFIFILSIIAIIYTSFVALAQTDMKKLIAYSSVAHMGFVTIGIFTINEQGITGAMFQMISHGLISAALFFCVGIVYDRLHTREIDAYGGVADIMPNYAAFFMIMMLASVGLPGTSGFVGEILVLVGAYKTNSLVAFLAATGIVLGAIYMLWLYRRVVFGRAEKGEVIRMAVLNNREIGILVPLTLFILWFGIYPAPLLDVLNPAVLVLSEAISNTQLETASIK